MTGALLAIRTTRQDAPVSVKTSGTYRHYFDEQGKRYSHVLDARTGAPVTHNSVSVTVINDSPTVGGCLVHRAALPGPGSRYAGRG